MNPRQLLVPLAFLSLAIAGEQLFANAPLSVAADFEGGSVAEVEIDPTAGSVRFMPGGDPARGWPCWWYFRIDGIQPGQTITLQLRGSTATVGQQKPLGASWAMPKRATYSTDGKTWQQSDPGQRDGHIMTYKLTPDASSVFVAWGPPYTPKTAEKLATRLSEASPHVEAMQLCRSREDREVPMLHFHEGTRTAEQRFGVWIQARQHAWESGSSWVAEGFADWLAGDDPQAAWLRQHADIYLVPIMDIDNTATGNGGKNAIPRDHNRDWAAEPHWNEILAAQQKVGELIDQNRMDLFIDLHNPGPGDSTFFFVPSRELLKPQAADSTDDFMELAHQRISSIKPSIPMSNKPRVTGSTYHPLWRQISTNWVSLNGNPNTVSVCLETAWNSPTSTPTGYKAVGENLAIATQQFLAKQPKKP
ncbi:M14-type cytosolic carboxypeptidase [Rosistilla oblonga]|uniref:M14-type cytosolic carboxypeptidase n=1 Tax=Rosistilla oblonga TaxID=2527990 RepID=UPI003A97FD7D